MRNLTIVEGYKSLLTIKETQKAIKLIKDGFQKRLSEALNLDRITAPLFVRKDSGLNDDLSGSERSVSFDIKALDGTKAEIVHSLAKWKRMALGKYEYNIGEGIYTDMNAIRRDDTLDNIHSIFVDQWDWELVISPEQRNIEFLKEVVDKIARCIVDVLDKVKKVYPEIKTELSPNVYYITAEELRARYPHLDAKEREKEITAIYKTVFIMQIGDTLSDGTRHDGRAPDYDDWTMNGDLLMWNAVLNEQMELSSMGIRVDGKALEEQLSKSNNLHRLQYKFHRDIVENNLPLTIGGGIGQSRLCMLMLEKLHIGEVQVSIWDAETLKICKKENIQIL